MGEQQRISLGRIVHFRPPSEDTSPAHDGDVYPGIVTGVYDDPNVADVCTFGQRSLYYQVKVAQLDPEKPDGGGWFWPPRAGG